MPSLRKANSRNKLSRKRALKKKKRLKLERKSQIMANDKKGGERQVTLIKASALKPVELWLDVYIVGDKVEQAMFAEFFAQARCRKAADVDFADLVVFTGGPDVDPSIYGETPHRTTRTDKQRDKEDLAVYAECLKKGIPMFGVCRGAQFLHVMNGGKLYQHVDGHVGDHGIFDRIGKRWISPTSSVHHQMVMETPGCDRMEVLAHTTGISTTRWVNGSMKDQGANPDIEAFFYRDTCSIGVQGHPEYRGYPEYTNYAIKLIEEYVCLNIDLEYVSDANVRRLKPTILEDNKNKPTIITNNSKETN